MLTILSGLKPDRSKIISFFLLLKFLSSFMEFTRINDKTDKLERLKKKKKKHVYTCAHNHTSKNYKLGNQFAKGRKKT